MARHGHARPGTARRGAAGRGKARQGKDWWGTMATRKRVEQAKKEEAVKEFIVAYLKTNEYTDALDSEFHRQFTGQFGGSVKKVNWGAATNASAMRWLHFFYEEGALTRFTVPLGISWQPGLPHWVYGYKLSNTARILYR